MYKSQAEILAEAYVKTATETAEGLESDAERSREAGHPSTAKILDRDAREYRRLAQSMQNIVDAAKKERGEE